MKQFLKNQAIFSKPFWLLLAVKMVFSFSFASAYMTKGFLPFVKYFIQTGKNPYDYFLLLHQSVFPYPALMLLIESFPMRLHVLLGNVYTSIFAQLFLMHIPILLADITIYIVLCLLLPSKEKRVLWYYFASPIIFYINYFHGQLDSIPTALLFVSLYFLFKNKYLTSYVILGLSIATKTHLLLIIPFYFIYAYKTKIPVLKILLLSFITSIVFLAPNVLFLSTGFLKTVLNNPEQQRLFFLHIPFEYKGIVLYIAPLAILTIWYRFASYKKINFDSLLLVLGLTFTVLIALVPPMQGWFYWSLPFLVYFFIKYEKANTISFWFMNVSYLLFFLIRNDSDIFQSASIVFPQLAYMHSPAELLSSIKISTLILQNVFFTLLEGSVVMNALWCYRIGMHYNNLYIEKDAPFVVGIGGNSGVGKSTLTNALVGIVGEQNCTILNGDDAHKWERGDKQWKFFTHLNPKSNRMNADYEAVYALKNGKIVERSFYSHKTGKFSHPVKMSPREMIVLQGLHPFFLKDMRNMFDVKIYLESSATIYTKWKLDRDTKERGYTRSQVVREMQRRAKDFKKFIEPQKRYANWIIRYDTTARGVLQASHVIKDKSTLDPLVDELKHIKKLSVHHEYKSLEDQELLISGTISPEKIQEIAYQLFPNMHAFLHNQPKFEKNITGVNQLIFLSFLNQYYLDKKQANEEVY